MQKIDSLLYPRWIVPIEPHDSVLENHAIAIQDGKILAILPVSDADKKYYSDEVIQLANHVVMPGLINCHTHSPMTLFRGMADDLALMDWLSNHIWPAELKWLGDEFVYDGTQLAIIEMLRSGTTCFNDNYFYANSVAQAAADCGMRACIGSVVINFSSGYANNHDDYINKAIAIDEQWRHHPLIKTSIAPHAPYTVNDEVFIKVRNTAEKYDMRIHLHLHEGSDEITTSLHEYQKRPLKRIHDLGLVSERLQCIHMTQINDEDIQILQDTHAHVIHCPESNLKLASGFVPIKQLMDAGINIGLGTDGAASNNDLDMFGEMRTASLLAKAIAKDPTALNAAQTLRMATLNGAKALGLDHLIGSIEVDKQADLIAVDLSSINAQPLYHPISHLAYATHAHQVSDVWVAGKQLIKNSEFIGLDTDRILSNAKEWRLRIQP